MKRFLAVFVFAALGGWASQAAALTGSAGGQCDGGQHVVTAGGFYDATADGDIVGVVFLRQAVGACLPDEEVPAAPVSLEIFDSTVYPGQEWQATASVPAPPLDIVYRYVAQAVHTDGTREAVRFSGNGYPPVTLVSCGDAPFLRGPIIEDPLYSTDLNPLYTFAPLPQDCWTEELFNVDYTAEQLESMLGGTMAQLLGQNVNAYGEIAGHDLVPAASHWITKVELVDPTVPAESSSWGGLKADYR